MKYTKFADIPKYTDGGHYRINMDWKSIQSWIDRHEKHGLELNPDFQRGHVWTEKQQIAFVEFGLQGGKGSNELKFNCVGWMADFRGPFVLVDGLQRLTAVTRFLNNEIKAFGTYYRNYQDVLHSRYEFIISVNDLKTREEVLRWYLEMNSSGVIHTKEELDRVRHLLEVEKSK